MTNKEASQIMEKTIINGIPHANTLEYMEALGISIDVLGVDYTRDQLKNWVLINKYPWLMPRDYETDEPLKDFGYTWHNLYDMGRGWWRAFGEMLCEEIQTELARCDCVEKLRIGQVKEKYGELRIYTYGTPNNCNVSEIIEKYTVLSKNICYFCGKPDVPIVCDGWIIPICKDCFITPDKGMEWKKKRLEEWDEYYSDDNIKMADCYHVNTWSKDKGYETTVYDISETANKIRKRYYGRT